MECRHGAWLDVEGGKQCLLCGEIIPCNETPVNVTEKAAEAAEDAGTGKRATRKRTPKNAK